MKLTYSICQGLVLKGRNGRKKLDNNTYLYKQGLDFVVKFHNNQIMKIMSSGDITVSNCGWLTPTTKSRLNDYTDLKIYQRRGVWYYDNAMLFVNGMIIQPKSSIQDIINEFQLDRQQTTLTQGRFL
jgi:hypothetical protein